MTKFLMFTKESCGPCGLVKKYITALKDPRESVIEEIYLDDFSNVPIPEENLELANCLLYTSPSPRDLSTSRMPSSA